MYKPLEDYISGLSMEEKQKHRALIEDCVGRSRKTKENINKIKEDIKTLLESWEELQAGQKNLIDSLTKLNANIADLYLLIRSEAFARSLRADYARSMN